jgi:hypothetical protein
MITTTLRNSIKMKTDSDTIYDWVVRIIDTCNNDFHFESVDKLIELYYNKTKDESRYIDLQLLRHSRYKDVHSIF